MLKIDVIGFLEKWIKLGVPGMGRNSGLIVNSGNYDKLIKQ